jgi:hypothetical protein
MDKILAKEFITKVYFSPLGADVGKLNKYEGFVISGDYQGITKLSK